MHHTDRHCQRGSRRSDPQPAAFTTIETHWRDLWTSDMPPCRHHIDPDVIAPALPSCFMLDHVADGVARIRVAGQYIHRMLRMDPRGMPFSALFAPETSDHIATSLAAAFTAPAIIGLPVIAPASVLRSALAGQILLLPLTDGAGRVNRLLGAVAFDNDTVPQRRLLTLDANRRIRQVTLNNHPQVHVIKNKKPNVARHPALRLVVNNA